MLFVFMGVAGCGKSTYASLISDRIGVPFLEGDDFHSMANVEAMRAGAPLDDQRREVWIDAILAALAVCTDEHVCLSCSALNENVRTRLTTGSTRPVAFLWLRASFETIERRLDNRVGHFMGARMLSSQFDALEAPQDAVVIDVERAPETVAAEIEAIVRGMITRRPTQSDPSAER